MAHLIDKDALVAEIERQLKVLNKDRDFNYLQIKELEALLSSLDTLEVKEVDLDKELTYEDYKSFFEKYPDLSNDWGFDECWVFATYFYKLGLKAQKGEEYDR